MYKDIKKFVRGLNDNNKETLLFLLFLFFLFCFLLFLLLAHFPPPVLYISWTNLRGFVRLHGYSASKRRVTGCILSS